MTRTTERAIPVPSGLFSPGDIVMLASIGVDMTVVDVCPDCGEVECAWFMVNGDDGWEYHRETFPSVALELAA